MADIEALRTVDWTFRGVKAKEGIHGLHSYPAMMPPPVTRIADVVKRRELAIFVIANRKVKGVKLPTDRAIVEMSPEFDPVAILPRKIPNKRNAITKQSVPCPWRNGHDDVRREHRHPTQALLTLLLAVLGVFFLVVKGMGADILGGAIGGDGPIAFFWVAQLRINPVNAIPFGHGQSWATEFGFVHAKPPIAGEGESLRGGVWSDVDPSFRPFIGAKHNQVVGHDAVATGHEPFRLRLLQNAERPSLRAVNRVEPNGRPVHACESDGSRPTNDEAPFNGQIAGFRASFS